ncbi:uncharacterized protein LOC142322865 isoform X2 [Lycorma delicatula]|uniref:uncharacterized protein LOC142322865 isoform X2 n=1 Tax=Lycorma delicatula TaxID=130591 RepID=UPI003F511C23
MFRQNGGTGCIFCTPIVSVYDCIHSSDTYFPCDAVSKIKIKCNKTHGIDKKEMRKRAQTDNNKMYSNTRAQNTPTFHVVKHLQVPELKKFASSSESSSDEDTENILLQRLGKSKEVTTHKSAYSNSDQLSSENQSDTCKEDKQWLENLKNFRRYNWFDCHAEMRSLLGSTERLQKVNDLSRTNVTNIEKTSNRLQSSGSNSMALRHQMGVSN